MHLWPTPTKQGQVLFFTIWVCSFIGERILPAFIWYQNHGSIYPASGYMTFYTLEHLQVLEILKIIVKVYILHYITYMAQNIKKSAQINFETKAAKAYKNNKTSKSTFRSFQSPLLKWDVSQNCHMQLVSGFCGSRSHLTFWLRMLGIISIILHK